MKLLVLAIGVACALACAKSSGTIFRAVPWPPAIIPQYNVDSVTRDTASIGAYALVGTVVDSASGKSLESVQVILRGPGGGRSFWTITDNRGGFVLGRVPPGHYQMIIRRIGYFALTGVRDAQAGVVDTLRAKMALSTAYLQAGRGLPTVP
jgi:hypothetical protein